jgi:hypothetical protein
VFLKGNLNPIERLDRETGFVAMTERFNRLRFQFDNEIPSFIQ